MRRILNRDYRRMLDLAVSLLGTFDREAAWQLVAAELMTSLDATIVGVFDIDTRSGAIEGLSWPAWTRRRTWDRFGVGTLMKHPLLRHYTLTGDTEPRASWPCRCRRRREFFETSRSAVPRPTSPVATAPS